MDAAPLGPRLRELARVFLKLGMIGFGGPAAHIALMEDELVRRRQWLSREAFLDLVGAVNLIPGPNSTEVAIHIGRMRAGSAGLVVAGSAFILPAFVIVATIGWAYDRYGTLPEATALLHGVTAVVLAIVIQALVGLGRTAIRNVPLALAAAAALAAAMLWPLHEVAILAVAGLGAGAVVWWRGGARRSTALGVSTAAWTLLTPPVLQAAAAATPVGLWPLFLVFAKAGSLLFGSGYVLLAFLRADLVERLGWLTNAQLLDAIAVGQITPGPVFTTATFIGYNLAGMTGAVVATVGIFLPAFVFVAVSAPLIPAMRRSPVAGAILDGVNVASLALMAAVTVTLATHTLTDATTVTLAVASAVLLVMFRINATLLIAAGAAIGFLFR
jgi:chromate transporter